MMRRHFRILFALEGKRILLALDAYNKDTPEDAPPNPETGRAPAPGLAAAR